MSTSYSRESRLAAKARVDLLNEFVPLCEAGETAGFAIYGDFEPTTDKRVLSREAIEEIRDAWNYMKFLELKRPGLRSPIQKIRAKLVMVYGELKKLEASELGK